MDIFELLKQLNKIEPDKNYTLLSKEKILNIDKKNVEIFYTQPKPKPSVLLRIVYSLSFVFSVFIIIFGAILFFKSFTPNLEALNPQAIKAEADAIDFQIQLSKIIYNTPENNLSKTVLLQKIIKNESSTPKTEVIEANTTTPTSTPITIEEVLDILSK
jgi:hypothetical protein